MTKVTQQPSKQYGRPDDAKIIPFMKIAKPAAIFSILITLASIFFIATKGLNLGLILQVVFQLSLTMLSQQIRQKLFRLSTKLVLKML